jgi:hypothetical protein
MRTLSIAIGLVFVAGCQDGKPKGELPPLHPVKGKVVKNGQPVGGGSVRFKIEPDDLDLVVSAEVKADGTFELHSSHAQSQKNGTGAPAGTYSVMYFPPMGDQTAGPTAGPVALAQQVTIQGPTADLTLDIGKK